MNEALFTINLKNWLYHKMILSTVSKAYTEDSKRKSAILNVKNVFGNFLKFPNNYSTGQLAILLKRHEDLLTAILPIPQNPTYEKSLATLQQLIKQAQIFINHYNLTT